MSVKFTRRLVLLAIALPVFLALAWAGRLGYRVWQYESIFTPGKIEPNFRSMDQFFDTNLIEKNSPTFPLESLPRALPEESIKVPGTFSEC
jgi:hypothetical protein